MANDNYGFDPLTVLPPQQGNTSLDDEYQTMGGLSARDVYGAVRGMYERPQPEMQQPMPVEEPLDTRVPTDQFIDLPTYQQTAPNLSPTEAYDEYLGLILPRQLQDMGYSPADAKITIDSFKATTPRPSSGVLGELGGQLKLGTDIAAQDVRGLARRFLPNWVTDAIEGTGKALGMPSLDDVIAQDTAKQTPAMLAAQQKPWLTEDATGTHMGPAFTDWRSYASGILQSAPESAMALPIAAAAVAIAPALGLEAAGTATLAWLAGGTFEGLTAGEQSGRGVTDEIMKMPEETLQKSQVYQQLLQTMTPKEARTKLASDADTKAFALTALSTLPFGGIGDAALTKIFRGEITGIAKKLGLGIAAETPEEFLQSGGQTISQNLAMQQADPTRSATKGALEQAVGGAVIGGITGGIHAGIAAPFARNPLKPETAPTAEPGTEPGTEPELPSEETLTGGPGGPPAGPAGPAGGAPSTAVPSRRQTQQAAAQEHEEVYAKVITELDGVRELLVADGVPIGATQYAKELDPIHEADDPIAAINDAITTLQGRTGKTAEATIAGLEKIRGSLEAVDALDKVRGAQQQTTPLQDVIRQTATINSGSGRRAARAAWEAHFERVGAINDATAADAEFANMEAERATTLQRQAQQQATATGTAPQPITQQVVSESTTRVENALKILPAHNQTAIRQRANQILQETVNAANQRLNQRGNAGDTRTQLGASEGPDLSGGREQNRRVTAATGTGAAAPAGRSGLNRLGGRQRAAVASVGGISGTATGTGSTIADRLIQNVLDGKAPPESLGLLIVAGQITQEYAAEVKARSEGRTPQPPAPKKPKNPLKTAPAATPSQAAAVTPAAPPVAPAAAPAPVAKEIARAQQPEAQAAAAPAPVVPAAPVNKLKPKRQPVASGTAPSVPSLGNALLSASAAAPAARRKGRQAAAAEPASEIPAGADEEVAAPRGAERTDTAGGTGNLRRGNKKSAVVPDYVGSSEAGAGSELSAETKLLETLMQNGMSRDIAWGLIESQVREGKTLPEILRDAARKTKKRSTVAMLIDRHNMTPEEAWEAVNAEDDSVWDAETKEKDQAGEGGALSPEMRDVVNQFGEQGGGISRVLDVLERRATTRTQKRIIKRLRAMNLQTPIRFQPGLPVKGRYRYNPATGTEVIQLNSEQATDLTLLHEILHAATSEKLDQPQTEQERRAKQELQALFDHVKANLPEGSHYGLKNLDEFVAEAFSNPEFQKVLEGIRLPGRSVSALSSFKFWVQRLLGIESNVLASAFATTEKLFAPIGSGRLDATATVMDKALESEGAKAKKEGAAHASAPSTAILGMDPKTGARASIAYLQKDGTYWHYRVDPGGDPRGTPTSVMRGLTRQDVEAKLAEDGHTQLGPSSEQPELTSTPPKATKDTLPGYVNGELRMIAYQQDDGSWNVYESTTGNVTTDPARTKTNVPNKAAVQARMNAGGFKNTPPSRAARVPSGGGGGANTTNVSPPAALTPGGPAKDLVLKRGKIWKWVPKIGGMQVIKLRGLFQDRYASIEDFGRQVDGVMAAHNIAVSDDWKVDKQAVLRNTRAVNRINEHDRTYTEPIREQGTMMEQKYGMEQAEIERDVTNLHFEERADNKEHSLDPGTDWTTGEAKKFLDDLNKNKKLARDANQDLKKNRPAYYADVVKLAELMKRKSDANVDMAVEYGLMDKDVGDRIKGTYKYYVPIQQGPKTVGGKTATGATAMGTNPFQRINEQTIVTVMRGEQNHIRRIVYELASKVVNVRSEDGKPVFNMTTPAKSKIKVNPRDFTIGYGSDEVSPLDPRAVAVFIDGKRHYMSIADDALFSALRMFSGEQKQTAQTAVIGMVANATHIAALGKTAMNPGFAVFNLARDIGTGFAQLPKEYSRVRFMRHLASAQVWGSSFRSAYAEAFGGEASGIYKQVKEAGGLVTQQAYAGLDPINAAVNGKFTPSRGDKLKRGGQGVKEFMMAFSQALESGTRLAIYNTVNEKHLADGMSPRAAQFRAATAAKTTTVNFETRGTAPLGPLYLFANAKVQGLRTYYDKLVNEKNPYTQAATVGMMMLGLLAAKLGYEDSDKDKDGTSKYGKIPQNKRDTLLLFHEGAKGIPIPQELSPFYALGNTMGDGIFGDAQGTPAQMGSRMVRVMMQMLSPVNTPQQDVTGYRSNLSDYLFRMVVPSVALPVYDLASNTNTFGSEIVAKKKERQQQGTPLREMYSKNENALAVGVAQLAGKIGIDVAPAQLKYMAAAFDPTGYTSFWSDALGSEKPASYPGQFPTQGGFDPLRPLEKRADATATSFADDESYNNAKQDVLEAKYYLTNPQALKRGGRPDQDTQRLASLAPLITATENEINTLYKGFKSRPQAADLAINTRKQQLQQNVLKRYYQVTGVTKGG